MDKSFAAVIDEQIRDAVLYDGFDRSGQRNNALRYFEGECPDIPPMGENRSKVVSRDVADTHGMIMPSLLRVFFAAQNVAIYEPTRKEHETFAQQATDYVNYVVMRETNGYRQFRDAFSDGLLLGNGILKHYWDPTPDYSTETFSGLSEDSYKLLLEDKAVEPVEVATKPDPNWVAPVMPMGGPQPGPMPPAAALMDAGTDDMGAGVPQAPLLYDCTIKRKTSNGKLRFTAIPHEEFLIERGAKAIDEQSCRFCAHVRLRTRSSLIAEGYKADVVNEIPAHTTVTSSQSDRSARDDNSPFSGDISPDKSTDLIEVYECFVQYDANDDGIAEWMRVVRAGIEGQRTTLVEEEWGDDLPFSDIVPEPRPYVWRGRGLYDELSDIQRIKTVMMRAIMDNTYWVLNPQRLVIQNQVENMDEVVNPTFGGNIFVKTIGAVQNLETPYIVPQVAPVIDYLDRVAQKRTGISEQTQALDLDALQNQSATAVNAAQSAAFSKVEEYARNIANFGGMRRVFKCILKLIVKHQDRVKTIRLRGQWVDMDPRAWDANMDVTINTGLGAGSRDRDAMLLSNIITKQEMAIQVGGPNNPLAPLDKYSAALRKLVEISGGTSPEQFFNEITPEQMAQIAQQGPPPDPKMMELQAKAQIEQQKMQDNAQLEHQKLQSTAQLEQQKFAVQIRQEQIRAQADAEREQAKLDRQAMIEERQAQADIAVRQREMEANMLLNQQKADHDMQLQREKFAFEKEMKLMEFSHRREVELRNPFQGQVNAAQ